MGSGNVGATNVWRLFGPIPAMATFLLDFLKGMVLVLVLHRLLHFSAVESLLVGAMVVVGHCFSYLLHFRGGKGVSTAYGVLLALHPVVGAMGLLLWLVVFLVTRVSALSALSSWFFIPILFYYFVPSIKEAAIILCLAVLIFIRHHSNIKKLWAGRQQLFATGQRRGKKRRHA